MNEQIKINWYRTKVDRKVMSELMKTSDFRGYCQVIPQLLLFLVTGTLAYLAYLNIHLTNWWWSVPLRSCPVVGPHKSRGPGIATSNRQVAHRAG